MSVTIDLDQIPPHPQPGQVWAFTGEVVLVLAVAPAEGDLAVYCTAYPEKPPLTFAAQRVSARPLGAFVAATHKLGAELLKGPGAPWIGG